MLVLSVNVPAPAHTPVPEATKSLLVVPCELSIAVQFPSLKRYLATRASPVISA